MNFFTLRFDYFSCFCVKVISFDYGDVGIKQNVSFWKKTTNLKFSIKTELMFCRLTPLFLLY
jgi:hypothetical protein